MGDNLISLVLAKVHFNPGSCGWGGENMIGCD